MQKINVLLIDDEEDALDSLEIVLSDFPQINIVKKILDPLDIFPFLMNAKIDLIFLDIKMPNINGIELLEKIRATCKPSLAVVLVSAFNDFAMDAVKNNAFSYLLKPVNRLELKATIEKLENYLSELRHPPNNKILITSKNTTRFVNFEEIVYLEAEGNYTKIHLNDRTFLLASYNLGSVAEKIPEDDFVKISRSIIVNQNYILAIKRKQRMIVLKFDNQEIELHVSIVFLKEFNAIFNNE